MLDIEIYLLQLGPSLRPCGATTPPFDTRAGGNFLFEGRHNLHNVTIALKASCIDRGSLFPDDILTHSHPLVGWIFRVV